MDRQKCIQEDQQRGGAGSTGNPTGGTLGSGTGIGNSTVPTAPIGSPSGSVR